MKISVLMSVYERENPEYFKAALESIFNQTMLPDEIVVVKDGKLTEELEMVLESVLNRNIPIVTHQFNENVQLGRALAKGLELCQNELVARMDTDDVACSTRLEIQHEYMLKNPNVAVCGGYMKEFNDSGSYSKIKEMPIDRGSLLRYAKYRNPLNHMTVMFRKSCIIKAGNYQHFPFLEDYYLWCRVIANNLEIANVPNVLVQMRTNENVYDRRGGWKYFKQYIQLRKAQKEMGLLNEMEYVLSFLVTMIITLQPAFLRKILYQKVLRK